MHSLLANLFQSPTYKKFCIRPWQPDSNQTVVYNGCRLYGRALVKDLPTLHQELPAGFIPEKD